MNGPFYGVFYNIEAYSQYLRWLNMERNDGEIRDEREGWVSGGSGDQREGRAEGAEEDRTNTVVPLRLITGGRSGGWDGDWLTPLAKGTIFLVKETGKESGLIPFCISDVRHVSRRLTVNYPDGTINSVWVDPKEFCKKYTFFEQIGQFFNEEDNNDSG